MHLYFCILASVLVSALALNQQQLKTIEKEIKTCQDESGVSAAIVEKAKNEEYIDDPKLKSAILCILKKLDLAKENGEVNEEKLKARVRLAAADEEETNEVYTKCVVKKDNPEETFFQITKCLHKELPKYSPTD